MRLIAHQAESMHWKQAHQAESMLQDPPAAPKALMELQATLITPSALIELHAALKDG